MTHIRAHAIAPLYRRIVWALLLACIALSALYVVFVGQTVFAVVERKNAQSSSMSLTTKLSALESSYLRLTDTMTPSFAAELGYTVNAPAHFVSRASLGKSLTLNNAF